MNNRHRRLLGFDGRYTEEECQRLPWDRAISEHFLLRPEIACPLSIDKHIWPSHFQYHVNSLRRLGLTDPSLIEADPDFNGGLWLDLERMKRKLQASGRSGILLAVEMFAPENTTVREYPSPLIYSRPKPERIPNAAVRIGYDVADAGFWSGLSNCGYTREELQNLRPDWAGRINDSGLLRNEEDAFAFKDISDARVPGHAPFWVYGLYRLEV